MPDLSWMSDVAGSFFPTPPIKAGVNSLSWIDNPNEAVTSAPPLSSELEEDPRPDHIVEREG